jgi:hypothetical protein
MFARAKILRRCVEIPHANWRSQSHLTSLLLFPPGFDPDWRTFEAEGAADLIFQEALIRKM